MNVRIARLLAILATATALVLVVVAQQRQPPMTEAQAAAAAAARDRAINPDPPPDPAAVTRGQALFASTCAFCHGTDASGQTAPNLLDVPFVIRDKNGDALGPFLKTGIPDQGMPAFPSVSAAQASDISAFLHDRIRLASDRFAQERPQVIVGNVAAGKAYFEGAGRCSTCHSATGDMAGIGKKYQPTDLSSRILNPLGYGGGAKREVRVVLASGETVTGVLTHEDEFYLDIVEAHGYERSYPADGVKITYLKPDPMAGHQALLKQFADLPNDTHLHDLVAYLDSLK